MRPSPRLLRRSYSALLPKDSTRLVSTKRFLITKSWNRFKSIYSTRC
ncbi:hypothetical protein WP1_286 [Pseudomonas phage WP1]